MVNKWLLHVAEFRKSHPSMPYSECLKMAKSSYTKVPKKMKGKGIVQDVLDDVKEGKLISKGVDYIGNKVKQSGYGKKKRKM